MKYEIIYAPSPEIQTILVVKSELELTVLEAIIQSGILEQYPEIDLKENKVGIFSKLTKLEQILFEGDRVEIYRPLKADPKEMRRKRESVKATKNKPR